MKLVISLQNVIMKSLTNCWRRISYYLAIYFPYTTILHEQKKWFPFGWKGRPSSMNRTKLGEGRHEMNKLCVNSGDSLGSLAITQIFTRKLHWALQALLQSKLFQHLMLSAFSHAIRYCYSIIKYIGKKRRNAISSMQRK